MSWIINSDYFTPLFDLRGKIEGLEGLDRKVMGFDFDRFVKDNVESNPPSSTDSFSPIKIGCCLLNLKAVMTHQKMVAMKIIKNLKVVVLN